MKLKMMIELKIICTLFLVILLMKLLCNTVFVDQGTIQYDDQVTKLGSTVGLFYVDGKLAFCMDHNKGTHSNKKFTFFVVKFLKK